MQKILILSTILCFSTMPAEASVVDKIKTSAKVVVSTPFKIVGKLYGFVTGAFIEGVYEGVQALE